MFGQEEMEYAEFGNNMAAPTKDGKELDALNHILLAVYQETIQDLEDIHHQESARITRQG